MLNFSKENRQFRTLDLLGLLAIVGVVFSLSGAMVAEALRDTRYQRALQTSRTLSAQVRSKLEAQNFAHLPGERGPANQAIDLFPEAGQLGQDPWGHPFHYSVHRQLTKDGKRELATVVVWSEGPDRSKGPDRIGNQDEEKSHDAVEVKKELRPNEIGSLESFDLRTGL